MHHQSVLNLLRNSTESPMMFYRVLIGAFTHVMNSRVANSEALLGDVLHQMHAKGHLLVVVTWSKGKGHLKVSGVHHMFIPPGEAVGDAFKQCVNFGGDGELGDDDCYRVRVLGELTST